MGKKRGPWLGTSGEGVPQDRLNSSHVVDLIYQEVFPQLTREDVKLVLETLWSRWQRDARYGAKIIIPGVGHITRAESYRGPNAPSPGEPNPVQVLKWRTYGPLAYEIDPRSSEANRYRKSMRSYLYDTYGSEDQWPEKFSHLK